MCSHRTWENAGSFLAIVSWSALFNSPNTDGKACSAEGLALNCDVPLLQLG